MGRLGRGTGRGTDGVPPTRSSERLFSRASLLAAPIRSSETRPKLAPPPRAAARRLLAAARVCGGPVPDGDDSEVAEAGEIRLTLHKSLRIVRTDRDMRLLTQSHLWSALFYQTADRFRAIGPSSVLCR